MAVPKGKVSKQRKHTRESSNSKKQATTLVVCPNCKELKQPHRACPKCGFYNGKKVVETEKKPKKEEQ